MLQKIAINILWYGECACLQHWNHLYSWERITQTIVNPSRTQQISHSNIKNTTDLTMKTNVRHICVNGVRTRWDLCNGVKTIDSENSSWKYFSLIGDEQVISVSSAQKSTYFQILYCVLVRHTRTLNQTLHGNKDWSGSKVHRNTEPWT